MNKAAEHDKPWVVLVSGSRDLGWNHIAEVARYIEPFSRVKYSIVIHGAGPAGKRLGAVGCDRLVDTVARTLKVRVFAALPLFDQQGPPGGPIRNQLMLNILTSHHMAGYRLAAGFFSTGGAGTEGMLRLAKAITTVPIAISEFPIELE